MTYSDDSRFSYRAPRRTKALWDYAFHRDDWEERCCPIITDKQLHEEYKLTLEEDLMLTVLSENIKEVDETVKRIGLLYRFLSKPHRYFAVLALRDEILSAISDVRHGNSSEWDRFKGMTSLEWRDWIWNTYHKFGA